MINIDPNQNDRRLVTLAKIIADKEFEIENLKQDFHRQFNSNLDALKRIEELKNYNETLLKEKYELVDELAKQKESNEQLRQVLENTLPQLQKYQGLEQQNKELEKELDDLREKYHKIINPHNLEIPFDTNNMPIPPEGCVAWVPKGYGWTNKNGTKYILEHDRYSKYRALNGKVEECGLLESFYFVGLMYDKASPEFEYHIKKMPESPTDAM